MLRYPGKPDYCHIVIESIIIMLALVIQFSIGAQLPLKVFLAVPNIVNMCQNNSVWSCIFSFLVGFLQAGNWFVFFLSKKSIETT